jgi:hypothetical protein
MFQCVDVRYPVGKYRLAMVLTPVPGYNLVLKLYQQILDFVFLLDIDVPSYGRHLATNKILTRY